MTTKIHITHIYPYSQIWVHRYIITKVYPMVQKHHTIYIKRKYTLWYKSTIPLWYKSTTPLWYKSTTHNIIVIE